MMPWVIPQPILGALWVFLMLTASMAFFDQLSEELKGHHS